MIIGIIANINKINVFEVVSALIKKLRTKELDFLLGDSLYAKRDLLEENIDKSTFINNDKLCEKADMIISIGGDGTMLATAYKAHQYDKPVLGINLGKLGFLAEANINQIDDFMEAIRRGKYKIGKRMVIETECCGHKVEKLYSINDMVIDKGGWPKMIDITIEVNGEYVTTFAADGIIAATPTGSTGYSISTGGPIVSPGADVITLSPISPHSLNIRPIVLPGNSEITIRANSLYKEIHVNCDGQRVFAFPPPLQIKIKKCERPLKLVHTSLSNYYETLRKKLLWGIDLRKNSLNVQD
ncbi:MAG: NAD(+)/NADH kinase [Ignavibacteriaceae bacterium]|jgi:NAD+ kinase